MRKTAVAVIVATAALISILASPAAAACQGAGARPGQQSTGEAQAAITCLINKTRAAHRLRAVRASAPLVAAALGHSNAMVSRNFFGHVGPDGTPSARVAAAGYMAGARAWGIGETLGWGIAKGATPRRIVRGWMHSAAHRSIMLRRGFRHVGVGVVAGSPVPGFDHRAATVTAVFGFRKG